MMIQIVHLAIALAAWAAGYYFGKFAEQKRGLSKPPSLRYLGARVPCEHTDDRLFSNIAPATLCADCGAWRMGPDDAWRFPARYAAPPLPDAKPDAKERDA